MSAGAIEPGARKGRRLRFWLFALSLALTSAFLLAVNASHASVFVVNSVSDLVDAEPGDGICVTSAGSCTLRAAIQEANASAGADTTQPMETMELDRVEPAGDADPDVALNVLGSSTTLLAPSHGDPDGMAS